MSWGASHLTVRLGSVAALDDVSLHVQSGQMAGVVGGDGAGKTTLLRVLAGARAVTAGQVRRPAAPGIGYMPASSGTYPDLSVDENLEFAAAAYGVAPKEARRRATSYLERAGLADFRGRLAGQLSGGMRQKLGVIRAMLHRPELVVLDEPTTGVDPVSRADLWWLIGRAAAEGAAVVFATTYLDEAERSTQLLVLDGGQTLAAGTSDEVVAATPGVIQARSERPRGDEARRAWRRRAAWRVWEPATTASSAGDPAGEWAHRGVVETIQPDLQDAVTVLALEREQARSGGEGAGDSSTNEARRAS